MATESGLDASPWQVVTWPEECFAIGNVLGLVGSWSVSIEQLQVRVPRGCVKRLSREAVEACPLEADAAGAATWG
jgi:hypothetical protein